MNESDLLLFASALHECGSYHAATKHFSLMDYMININIDIDCINFGYSFEILLELFVFRYRAIYTEDRLFTYMISDDENNVINKLIKE